MNINTSFLHELGTKFNVSHKLIGLLNKTINLYLQKGTIVLSMPEKYPDFHIDFVICPKKGITDLDIRRRIVVRSMKLLEHCVWWPYEDIVADSNSIAQRYLFYYIKSVKLVFAKYALSEDITQNNNRILDDFYLEILKEIDLDENHFLI